MNSTIAPSSLGALSIGPNIARIPIVQKVGTAIFAIALVLTLLAGRIYSYSHHFPKDSIRSNILYFLGEVEVVFGIWAGVFMAMTATRPIVDGAAALIGLLARALPLPSAMAFYASAIFLGHSWEAAVRSPRP
jgi:hypothetical protein